MSSRDHDALADVTRAEHTRKFTRHPSDLIDTECQPAAPKARIEPAQAS
nr:hypothetical protein [Pararhizobium sp. IMCC3301]